MKKATLWAGAAIVAALCSFPAKADKAYYVDPDGNQPEGLTVDAVYKTVKAAVAAVTTDEATTIYLKPGHVFDENNLTTGTVRANLKIVGSNTTLNAGSNQRLLRTEAARLELKGITFTGVADYANMGGVLYFAGNANAPSELMVDSCVFEGNSLADASSANGGVAIATGANNISMVITNSVFRNNETKSTAADKGGLIYFQGKNGTIEVANTTFADNITRSASGAMVLNMVSASTGMDVRFANCTFFNNTTTAAPGGSTPNILLGGTANTGAVVNNTFYFDRREEDPGEGTGDAERAQAVFKRTAAVNIPNGSGNTLHFVNNVVTGTRCAVISAGTDNRTITCHNNYCVVLEGHTYVSELADGQNGNVLNAVQPGNDGNPFMEEVEQLTSQMATVGIASALATDNFVPYLAIDATSPLRNAGVAEYLVGDANVVPAADIRGVLRNDGSVDIGAYEYASETPGPGTGIQTLQADAWVSVYTQADRVVIENRTDADLALTLVGADGRRIAAMPLQRTLSLDRAALPQGLLLLMVQHGDGCATEKIVL